MKREPILPGSTVGVLGGGQLGRMIAMEAKRMGYETICLDPRSDSPCGQVADHQILAPLNDVVASKWLAERSDVIVYETENVDVRVVEELEKNYYLPQSSRILSIAQNRIAEKKQLQSNGFPVVPFRIIRTMDELEKGMVDLGFPSVLKTTEGGYDGKGQTVIRNIEELRKASQMLQAEGREWVLEKHVSVSHEISVIVARKETGEMAIYPVAENIHRESILHMTVVPARVSSHAALAATEMAKEIAHVFEVVGLLAVEFFITDQGLVVNELAPRPHNSGHYTWDACYTSQFEQLLRVVCDLPLGSTQLLTPVVMVNILGGDLPRVMEKISNYPEDVKIHLYGKHGNQDPRRKMGHLIIKTDHPDLVALI